MPRPIIPVHKASRFRIAIALLRHPSLWPLSARLLVTIWRDFFWPQYRLRLLGGRHITAVDGPLDSAIPFRSEYFKPYLEFVSLWLETLAFTRRELGAKSLPDWKIFVSDLESLYREAGAISRDWPTTTRRPSGWRGSRMAMIKFFDPHYHCLPSLHILILLHTHSSFQTWVTLQGMNGGEPGSRWDMWGAYLRREMLEITESVLYVKQHSISCIAGSLFFFMVRFPHVEEAFATEFIEALFESENDVPAGEIRAAIRSLYGEFQRRHREGVPVVQVLVDYIRARP